MTRILIATLGGSPEPVITAIRQSDLDHVCLVCTTRDLATGKPGSETQVPAVIKQCGLDARQVSTLVVPADDLDGAFTALRGQFDKLRQDYPGAELTADYTGGTKSMCGALILAALDAGDVSLQVVTGNRADLVKVRDGTQAVSPANDEALRLNWGMRPSLDAWSRYAYDEAAAGLDALPRPRNPALRDRLNRARDLSLAFAAWDRFDHAEALRLLEMYAPIVSRSHRSHIGALKALTSENTDKKSAFQIFDLWNNAQRRAEQGRYDDAVARCYRLCESIAQWILRVRVGLDTADLSADKLPSDMALAPNRHGQLQAGLYAAWQLVGHLTDGPAARLFSSQGNALLNHLQVRNTSILAHGFTPLEEKQWRTFADWIEQQLLPAFIDEAGTSIIRSAPTQLPSQYGSFDASGF